jgi:hypothetical protein
MTTFRAQNAMLIQSVLRGQAVNFIHTFSEELPLQYLMSQETCVVTNIYSYTAIIKHETRINALPSPSP